MPRGNPRELEFILLATSGQTKGCFQLPGVSKYLDHSSVSLLSKIVRMFGLLFLLFVFCP